LPSENEVPVGLFFSYKENYFFITVITSSGFINKLVLPNIFTNITIFLSFNYLCILIILRFICDNVMELTEQSSLDNDLKSITFNTYDIHENVS